jgi:predicted outer membrane repeat protein
MKPSVIMLIMQFTIGIIQAADAVNGGAVQHTALSNEQLALGGFVTVGGDPNGCHFDNIQEAIDAVAVGGEAEIRIATNKTYFENLSIDDLSLSLIGGYSDCQDASLPFPPSLNQVVINGGNLAPVVKITGQTQRNSMTLKNLRLIEGLGLTPNSEVAGGGLLAHHADVILNIENTDFRSNDAEFGAGIAIIEGDTDVRLYDSLVINNLAKYGGGIYCSSAASSVVINGDSGVVANVANGVVITGDADFNGRAGGVYVSGCYFSMTSGSAQGGTLGIAANIAYGNGGGIYADNGATVVLNGHISCHSGTCADDNQAPVNVSQNQAGFADDFNGSGGGIYAVGASTSISLYAGLIENNRADNFGGGIYIRDAELTIRRLQKSCWDPLRCNYFDGNVSRWGGAISNAFGRVDVSSTYFENNQAVDGAVVYSVGFSSNGARTLMEGSVINHNGDSTAESIIYTNGSMDVELVHMTVADNTVMSNNSSASIIRSVFAGGGPDLSLHASIVDNDNFQVLTHDMLNYAVDISCVMANEIDSMTSANNLINASDALAGGAFLVVDNPIFLDRANFNYLLAGNSPAIDYCHTPTYTDVLRKDIQYENRGLDDPFTEDLSAFTFYDLGADESYINDVIFKSGF